MGKMSRIAKVPSSKIYSCQATVATVLMPALVVILRVEKDNHADVLVEVISDLDSLFPYLFNLHRGRKRFVLLQSC